MSMTLCYYRRAVRTIGLVLTGVLICAGSPALAQQLGPTGPKPRPKPPVQPDQPQEPGDKTSAQGVILKFEAADSSKDANAAGYLSIKPLAKDAKVLRLTVPKGGDFHLSIGSHTIGEDEYATFPWKGLLCEVRWSGETDEGDEGRNSKPREKTLQSLMLETLQVRGKIVKIGDDTVALKAKPVDNRDWPDLRSPQSPPKGKPGNSRKPPKVAARKLTARILDGISECLDDAGKTAGLKDFTVGEKVKATVAYGMDTSIVISLEPITKGDGKDSGGGDKGGGRPGRTPRTPKPGDKGKPPGI
jgi:hypothetical protein